MSHQQQETRPVKPLGRKVYGSIGHLPWSRTGPADRHLNAGQVRILTERARDRHDEVILTEKLDGSNCGVTLLDGQIIALGRAGYPAWSSPFEQHHLFAHWVQLHDAEFRALLDEGELVVGEWLSQAHGTRYRLDALSPFAIFDLFTPAAKRHLWEDVTTRVAQAGLVTAPELHRGAPISIDDALKLLGEYGYYGAQDKAEGVVYRVERRGTVDFLGKYVYPDKIDGRYLPEISGEAAIWNWRP